MGQLLGLLQAKGSFPETLTIDFENSQPHPRTQDIYDACERVLERAPRMLDEMRSYGLGCAEQIRVALSTPSEESNRAVWVALQPKILVLKEMHGFAKDLGGVFPELLAALCTDDPQGLTDQQALARQIARIFDFVLKFDSLKMHSPQVSNDFAFFRRNSSRLPPGVELPVTDSEATTLSLYFANPTPMLHTLTESVSSMGTQPNIPPTLGLIAASCYGIASRREFQRPETEMLVLRCMVASIVLLDHVDPKGAFHRKSGIPLKKSILHLKQLNDQEFGEGLLNSLRFSTKHLHDEDTPTFVTELLGI